MSFTLYKLRIVAGCVLGLYDRRRMKALLLIINTHARQSIPDDCRSSEQQRNELSSMRLMWVFSLIVLLILTHVVVMALTYAGVLPFEDMGPAFWLTSLSVPAFWLTQFPTMRSLHRRDQLGRAILEVSKSALDTNSRGQRL